MATGAVHLRGLWLEGLRAVLRLPGRWFLPGMALALTALAFHAPLPFREPGRFNLQAVALINQFTLNLLVVTLILVVRPTASPPWWPLGPFWAMGSRQLGTMTGVALLLAPLVAAQYLWAWALREVELRDPLSADTTPLGGAYGLLGLRCWVYASVLLAWGVVLRSFLGATASLLGLLTLMFAAFLLPHPSQATPALMPLVALLPRLGALAPVADLMGSWGDFLGRTVPYAITHVGLIWAMGALLRRTSLGDRVDFSS